MRNQCMQFENHLLKINTAKQTKTNIDSHINPFMPNLFSHSYRLDESISKLRVVGWYFSIFIQILKNDSVSKQWIT